MKLKEKNFVGAGPLDISFEEGREKIGRNVFREAGCNGRCFKVTLPNSCKVIGEYAFYDYQGKLHLNKGLKRIEAYALSRTTCDLPESVEYLGEHALESWSPQNFKSTSKTADIKDFRLPSSLKYIGDECIELENLYPSNIVVIPKSVEKIGKNAFKYLTCADVPKERMPRVRYKVEKGNKWFYSDKDGQIHKICRKDKENANEKMRSNVKRHSEIKDEKYFEIKEDVLVKYKGGFLNEGRIILPSRVKRIGKKAFSLDKKEKKIPSGQLCRVKITIPKDVKLDKYAFDSMGPMSVSFEEGREEIEEYAFCNAIIDSNRFESDVYLPNSVKVLKKYCFNTLEWLHVHLGDGVEIVENYALADCDVESLPDSIIELKDNAVGLYSIKDGHLPKELKKMGKECICNMNGRVKISKKITQISPGAIVWNEETADTSIGYDVDSENPYYKSDNNGWLYSKDGKTLLFADLQDTHYKIPDGVKRVSRAGLFVNTERDFKVKIKGLEKVDVVE